VLVERDAQFVSPLPHLVAVHAAGERFVLELLLHRRQL